MDSSKDGTIYNETYMPEAIASRLKSSSAILLYGRIGRSRGSVNLPVVILTYNEKYITRYITYNIGHSLVFVIRGSSRQKTIWLKLSLTGMKNPSKSSQKKKQKFKPKRDKMAKILLSNDHKLTILWLELIEITSQKDLNLRRITKKIIKEHKEPFNHRKNTRGV